MLLVPTLLALVSAAPALAPAPPLQSLAPALLGRGQGVYVHAEDGTVLVAQAAERPVQPASVTKIATTLALLQALGPDFRFDTRILATGPVRDGALAGSLVVEAATDPFLVFENAQLMLLALRAQGLGAVDGGLVVRGDLLFDWRPDPNGRRLRRTLEGRDGAAAWAAVRAVRADALADDPREVGLRFLGHGGAPDRAAPRTLLVHRSPPLARVVKGLNCWSNNVFNLVSRRIGGPAAVERAARAAVPPPMRDEIVIDDAAGAGKRTRLSPRAAAALLDALAATLARHRLELSDVLPVSGADPGTLHERLGDRLVVGKTGSYGSYGASALVGVLSTERYGHVTFAILNRGVPVKEAQRRQDAFVRALAAATGARPWPYVRRDLPTFAEAEVRSGGG